MHQSTSISLKTTKLIFPETNIAHENGWLKDDRFLWDGFLAGANCNIQAGYMFISNNMMNILPSFLAFLVNHCEMHLGDESKLGIGHQYVVDVFFQGEKLLNLQSVPDKCLA